MTRYKTFIIVIIFLNSSIILSNEQETYLFNIVCTKSDKNMGLKYTNILYDKLKRTDVFNILLYENFELMLENTDSTYIKIKESVLKNCFNKKIRSVIFGFLMPRNNILDLRIVFYSVEDDEIITEFSDRLYSEHEIEKSAENCALEFATRHNSIKSTRYFFGSLFMPGLGQFMMKNYLRSLIFSSGVGYCLYEYSTAGSTKSFDKDAEIRVEHNIYTYYFNGNRVTYTFLEKMRMEYRTFNKELQKKKERFEVAAAFIYLINIADILVSIKEYNSRIMLKRKLSVNVYPSKDNLQIALRYRF